MRRGAGLNLTEAASRLRLSGAPALSQIENGKQRVPAASVSRFLEAYGVASPERQAAIRSLADLAASRRRTSTLTQYRYSVPDPFAEFIQLEELAQRMEVFSHLVPGLLQTEEYAGAVVAGSRNWSNQREVAKYVDLRMLRQQVLRRQIPLGLWCVIDEAALRREVGGPEVMRRQLRHLLTVTDELPTVVLQVLPFARGAHAGMDGAFMVLHFEVGPPVAVVEPMTTSVYLEEDDDVGRYEASFRHLRSDALDMEQSRSFIRRLIEDTSA